MRSIDIYRGSSVFVNIKIDGNSNTQNKTIMGENFLQLEFELSYCAIFKINDYCNVFGEVYKVRELPVITKETQFKFRYSMKLHSEASDLAKVQYLFLGSNNDLKEPEFSLMGNAQTFLNLILSNATRILSGWTLGQVISTDYKNLTFSNETCLSALAKIAEAFGTEWWIIGKKIHLTKISTDTGRTFKHGRAKGLYEIQRYITNGSNIITRLYPFGGDKNLPANYGSKRLRPTTLSPHSISGITCTVVNLPDGTSNYTFNWTPSSVAGTHAVTISERPNGSGWPFLNFTGSPTSPVTLNLPTNTYDFYFTTQPWGVQTPMITIGPTGLSTPAVTGFPNPYIENNVSMFGIIEYTQIFDDIYPRRTGTVTAVDATDHFVFTDSAIDFDVNAQLAPGLTAKVVFNTGQLSGYQFEIRSFNNSTKVFTLLKNKDETTLDIPSSTLKPAIGDKYVLVDIRMPASYIAAAENELLIKAQDMLAIASMPQYNYNITLDPKFIKDRGYTINIGDEVGIDDTDLQVNRKIRVVNTVRNLVEESQYQLQLSDSVQQGIITQINNNLSSAQQGVSNLNNQFQHMAIFNGKVIGDLKIEQGTFVMPDIPQTGTMTGFENIVREISTGKLYRKV